MTLDRLSTEDVQVLKREGGAIRGHTCKVIVLDRSGGRPLPTLDGLRQHISARLDAAPRLRQRLVATPLKVANPAWLDDPEFDIARHVTRVPENGVADQCELEANIAGLMTPADDVYVLGAKVSELYSLAEVAQHHALRVAVISCGGSLFFGLCADRGAVTDLDVLADGLRRSVKELLSVSGPSP